MKNNKFTAFIYAGTKEISPSLVTEYPTENDTVIAADSGFETASLLGIIPNLLIGDFDSFSYDEKASLLDKKTEIIKVNPHKKETDTMLAVNAALERGFRKIVIVGGMGGRCDHFLSCALFLERLRKIGADAVMTNGENRLRVIKNEKIRLYKSNFKYFSIVSLSDACTGVSVSGAEYPLDNAELERDYPYAVSNEINGEFAEIEIKDGCALIIEAI